MELERKEPEQTEEKNLEAETTKREEPRTNGKTKTETQRQSKLPLGRM